MYIVRWKQIKLTWFELELQSVGEKSTDIVK